MPDPQSRRGNPITAAPFEAPFQTPVYPLGVGGVDLASAIDKIAVGRFSRLTNCVFTPNEGRELTGRLGQTVFATTAAAEAHSITRLDDLTADSYAYVVGVGTNLYLGASGALTAVDSGYSGDPLTFVPLRPPLSGDPWTYIGDRTQMRAVRYDGTAIDIGQPAPGAAPTTALATKQATTIIDWTANPRGTWTPNAGYDFSNPPQETDNPGAEITGPTTFTTNPGTAVLDAGNGYWQFWGLARNLDLSVVGADPASDDDLMHLTIKLANPALMAECRLYLVCAETFSPSVLPGLDDTVNQDFYMKSFRPSDFTPVVQALQAQIAAAEQSRVATVRQAALEQAARDLGYSRTTATNIARAKAGVQPPVHTDDAFQAQRDPARDTSVIVGASSAQFVEFGTVGIPLRRGDWKRYGSTAGRDWSTITGLIVYIQTLPNAATSTPENLLVFVDLLAWELMGGAGPDAIAPDAQAYDYRYTHYDPRTGDEGNGSPIQDESLWLDALRRAITVTPAAAGDSAVRQRIYRRGGALTDDWYYVGVNDSDGGAFEDTASDLEIAAAGTLPIDHYQPVPTVDENGDEVLGQPVPVLFGPYNGMLLALGDPYRPGFVYASLPNQPGAWPADLTTEVCPASEELMNGVMYGTQAYVFSRLAGYGIYANLTGATGITSAPTGCKHGLAGRWAIAVGGGAIWIVSTDNIYRTQGGPEEPVANDLWPLFNNQTRNGYAPIDFSEEAALRLAVYLNELWFSFLDTEGAQQTWVYQIPTGQWRHYQFGVEVSGLLNDPQADTLILGGRSTGSLYTHEGTSDDGTAITGVMRTNAWDAGELRGEKVYGDVFVDVDPQGLELVLQNFMNNETVTNPTQTFGGFSGRSRVIFDAFGTGPQIARNITSQISWAASTAPPVLYLLGASITLQPDLTVSRVTNWDDLGHPDVKYVYGVTFDCDTNGETKTILIEGDMNGVISTIATLSVTSTGRHKLAYTWTGAQVQQIRVRPTGDCEGWLLYRADWLAENEPPSIAGWDSYFESGWDQYYTGLDLYVDTFSAPKTVVVTVDGVILNDPATGFAYWTVQTTGRQVVHLTLPTGRGHVFRFYATDANPGQLYAHRWHLVPEPSEQANWNAPYQILGTQADKYLKAVVFEIDTFGQTKTVSVEADGAVVATLSVTANGRKVVQAVLPGGQQLGRVWRFIPTDNYPSRLYSVRPVFDEEPFALSRWETQWIDHGERSYHSLIDASITLRSSGTVTLTIQAQVNQTTGATVSDPYEIPSTGGVKQKIFVPFQPRKGVLYKYTFTADTAFWLYREESAVTMIGWNGGAPRVVKPFGNDDTDPTRGMVNATMAAAQSGGGS